MDEEELAKTPIAAAKEVKDVDPLDAPSTKNLHPSLCVRVRVRRPQPRPKDRSRPDSAKSHRHHPLSIPTPTAKEQDEVSIVPAEEAAPSPSAANMERRTPLICQCIQQSGRRRRRQACTRSRLGRICERPARPLALTRSDPESPPGLLPPGA